MNNQASKIKNITNDLNIAGDNKNSQKFVYIDQTKLEENENNIAIGNGVNKVSFSDVLKNFDIPSLVNESTQAKLKNTLKNFVLNKDKSKVEIKFDDTETKVLERKLNYDTMSKDITKYQRKVKINREADVIDFTTNNQPLSFTGKSLLNNTSSKDLNSLEKYVKDVLIKSKYDTEENIIQEENRKLLSVNPEELKKRYDELKKVKNLLFQQEMKNKRKSKIKSKLYHKIKKKQKEREENVLLQQLEEVDPEGVKVFLEKKKLDRAKERVELKHSFNSKFNKTVKRYNLQKDENVKEAIKENLKLRDELMRKIKTADEDEDKMVEDEVDDYNQDNSNEDDNIEEENEEEEDEQEIEEDKLLFNFDENSNHTDIKQSQNKDNKQGIWGMKFMKNSDSLQNKLKDVLNEVDDDDEEDYNLSEDGSDLENIKKRNEVSRNNKKQKVEENECEDTNNIKTNNLGARRKNILEDNIDRNINTSNVNKTSKITNNMLQELNEDAKKYTNKDDDKVNFNADDIQKLVRLEQVNEDEELFTKFLIQNDDNKKEFLQEAKPKVESNTISGWGTWAGESKTINAKEFLRKKRHQDFEKKKEANASNASNASNVKINKSFDKKLSNYMVKELPNNLHSQEEYDKLNKTAFGKEWNSLTMYKKLIQPSVVKKIGQIIEPMRINDNTNAKKLCEIIEKMNKKKQRTKSKM